MLLCNPDPERGGITIVNETFSEIPTLSLSRFAGVTLSEANGESPQAKS
jgi:hypothetical protein